jgi:hypothetical protein
MLQGARRLAAAMVLASVMVLAWTPAEARTQPMDLSRESLYPFSMLVLPGDPFAHAMPLLSHHAAPDTDLSEPQGRLRFPAGDSTRGLPGAGGTEGGRTAAHPAPAWTGSLDPLFLGPLFPLLPLRGDRPHAG